MHIRAFANDEWCMKEKIFSQYPCRIELHTHINPRSGCSTVTPVKLVRIYAPKAIAAAVMEWEISDWQHFA